MQPLLLHHGLEWPAIINPFRPGYRGLPRWTPHDLRRTAATKLSELGCPDEIIDAILNHAKQGVIGVYNRNKYDTEKKEWLSKWSLHLKRLVSKEMSKWSKPAKQD